MNTIFWILWFFIAIVVVLVAFTLRKESEEMRGGRSLPPSNPAGAWVSLNGRSSGPSHGSTPVSGSRITGTCRRMPTTTCTVRCR